MEGSVALMSSPAGGYSGSRASSSAKRVETRNKKTNAIRSKASGRVLMDGTSFLLVTAPVHSNCSLQTTALAKAKLVPQRQVLAVRGLTSNWHTAEPRAARR